MVSRIIWKRVLISLIPLVVFIATAGAAGNPEQLERNTRDAIVAGDLPLAEKLLVQLLTHGESPSSLVLLGRLRNRRLDPVAALHAFRRALLKHPGNLAAMVGLGQTWLSLKEPERALQLALRVLAKDKKNEMAWDLNIRSLLDLGKPEAALARSDRCLEHLFEPTAIFHAARGAALFRCRKIKAAAGSYRMVLATGKALEEAHIRLGSGLLPAGGSNFFPRALPGLAALHRGDLSRAASSFTRSVKAEPFNPVYHRLLGEVLHEISYQASFLAKNTATRKLEKLFPDPGTGKLDVTRLFPQYSRLSAPRQRVINLALRGWAKYLPKLIANGGRHDILNPTELTTAARDRSYLRGTQTPDGRYWDNVRGLGGLEAATGVETLDQAARFGFNTLAHEVTHQVHLFAMPLAEKRKIQRLYNGAMREGRCLDYYAATCVAEYIAQGYEAFVSLAKRPGTRRTHSHTRFELLRLDPALEKFLREKTSWDPLAGPQRAARLEAAAEMALISGRFKDVLTAVSLLGEKASVHAIDLRDQAMREERLALQP